MKAIERNDVKVKAIRRNVVEEKQFDKKNYRESFCEAIIEKEIIERAITE